MPENKYFGHKLALAWFCELQAPKPINGTVPHGWSVDMGPSRRKIGWGPLFVWNERLLTQARSLGVRNVDCVGAPFTYLVRLLWPDGRYPQGQGTLVLMPLASAARQVSDCSICDEHRGALAPPPYTGVVRFLDSERAQGGTLHLIGWRFAPFG